jgi:hypothetical protein
MTDKNKHIPHSECIQGQCANITTGCWGECSIRAAFPLNNVACGDAVTRQAAPEAPYRVAEFWSSANPGKKVRMLAEGADIAAWSKRGDFIRWVDASPVAALEAPASIELRGCTSCEWTGDTDRMCGSIGPLCPECGDTTEFLGQRSPAATTASESGEAIPVGVYYSRRSANFYEMSSRRGMGWSFYKKWRARAEEFPDDSAPAPSREAAPQAAAPKIPAHPGIKTWQERAFESGVVPTPRCKATGGIELAMEAEIVDLRAAIAQQSAERAADAGTLSVMLWLLRRLPRAYENPPHVVQAIKRLAGRTGTDVAECLNERAAHPGEAPAGGEGQA